MDEYPELDESDLLMKPVVRLCENNPQMDEFSSLRLKIAEIKTQQLIYKQLHEINYWLENIAQRI